MPFIDPLLIPPTGNSRIDAGHQELAERINALYEKWQNGVAGRALCDDLERLVRAIGRHFIEEEAIVREQGFDDRAAHSARHKVLLKELTQEIRKIPDAGAEQVINVFRMIDMLIYEHEVLDDQEYWELFGGQSENTPARPAPELVLQWSESFATGLEAVDRDHRLLIALLNHLHDILARGASHEQVGRVLRKVLEHTESHFAWEEAYIAQNGFPGLDTHRLLHQDLLKDLHQLLQDHANGRFDSLDDLLFNYLKYWLVDHIVHVDSMFVACKAEGVADKDR